jgi:hypothetical protein
MMCVCVAKKNIATIQTKNARNRALENIFGEMGLESFGVPECKQKITDTLSHYCHIYFFLRLSEVHTVPYKTNQSPKQFLRSDFSRLN